ncbi:DsbA family protein [Candidatus Giovannonibacteria bacterium]|nr:DsbA family protein [Candidatus Giovannonibacteria bacterium]
MKNSQFLRSGNTSTWVALGVILVFTVGFIYLVFKTGGSGQNFKETTASAIMSTDWISGKKEAKVSVIEYADFQCPACAAYYPMVKQLVQEYGDRVVFAFRNFPLYQVHKNAEVSAQAAEAAGIQGKYMEMMAFLYDNQKDWSLLSESEATKQYFDKFASQLGLDLDRFHQDMKSDQVKNKIAQDIKSATAAQVDHTPTFFVNQKQIPNPRSYDEFKSIIESALQSS